MDDMPLFLVLIPMGLLFIGLYCLERATGWFTGGSLRAETRTKRVRYWVLAGIHIGIPAGLFATAMIASR